LITAKAFRMGGQHACCHKASRFIAAAAQHGYGMATAAEAMGNGKAN
jgi:hypothetical protein